MITMFIPSYKVEAKTLQDLKNELADLKSKKAATENNKNLTDSQIKSLRVDIDNTQIEIENTKKEIIAATEKISSSENEIEEQDKETSELLKFLQVSNGENVYLEYLFEADSYTDFIYRYSVVSQLTEYNSNLMESSSINENNCRNIWKLFKNNITLQMKALPRKICENQELH